MIIVAIILPSIKTVPVFGPLISTWACLLASRTTRDKIILINFCQSDKFKKFITLICMPLISKFLASFHWLISPNNYVFFFYFLLYLFNKVTFRTMCHRYHWLASCLFSCSDPKDDPTCYCTGLKKPLLIVIETDMWFLLLVTWISKDNVAFEINSTIGLHHGNFLSSCI